MSERQTITPELKALVRLFWSFPEAGAGGPLHIWFEDSNWERTHVAWLADYCRARTDKPDQYHPNPDLNRLGAYIARIGALYLTDTQRKKLPYITSGPTE